MALVPLQGAPQENGLYRQMMINQLIGGGLQGFAQASEQQKQKQAMGELLAGKAGPGLGALTQQGAPGLDPSLAGPALGMSQPGGMAQKGLIHTGGQMTPQMAQAFVLQGGDPSSLAGFMPKQMTPYETAQVDIERQKLAQGPGPASSLGKVAADLGLDISTPEGLAAAQQAMINSSRAPVTNINMPGEAKLSDISSVRGQFQGESKDFGVVKDAYGKLRSALQHPSPAGDISIVYAYNQMLDPKSVVRTQDFEAAAKAGDFGDKIRSAVSQITSGQLLTDAQRADFANQAHGMFQSQLQSQQARASDYKRMVGATMENFPPEVAVPDVIGESGNWQTVVPPPAPPVPTMAEQTGGLLQQFGDMAKKEWGALTGGGSPAQAAPVPGPQSAPQAAAKPPLTPQQLQSMSIDELAKYYAQP